MKRFHFYSIVGAIAALGLLPISTAARDGSEAAAWEAIRSSASPAQIEAFLASYPTGQFAREARARYSLTANTMLPPEVVAINPRISLSDKRVGRTLGPLRVVKLNILVQEDGTARDVKLVRTSGYDGYDREARRAARSATYLPGLDRGMVVEAAIDYEVSFGLLCNRAAGNTTCDYRRFPTACSATVCAKLLN